MDLIDITLCSSSFIPDKISLVHKAKIDVIIRIVQDKTLKIW